MAEKDRFCAGFFERFKRFGICKTKGFIPCNGDAHIRNRKFLFRYFGCRTRKDAKEFFKIDRLFHRLMQKCDLLLQIFNLTGRF